MTISRLFTGLRWTLLVAVVSALVILIAAMNAG